jgi:uncharacterized protein
MTQPSPRLRELTLTMTDQCNLRCSYCYVSKGNHGPMKPEVVDAAVALFAKHADDHGNLTLSFFGGEPFLDRPGMAHAIRAARTAVGDRRALRLATPTNGLLLDEETLSFCKTEGIRLAMSIDGVTATASRCDASGRDCGEALQRAVSRVLSTEWEHPVLARMTVTPANVADLANNVRALTRMGFRKIIYLPDVEQSWSDEAIARWGAEHERIGTWLVGAWGAGVRVPVLPTWRSIEKRLLFRTPKRACGAGERLAAVTTDGRLVPCYRFAFEQGEDHVLGNVHDGFTRDSSLARFAGLDAGGLHPQEGSCETCDARDGCTHFCAAQGWLALRDPLGVPALTCKLMRAQVAVIRTFAAVERGRKGPMRRPPWAAAAMLAAMAAFGVSACGGDVETGDNAADSEGPGVCPMEIDASDDQFGPGQCPVQIDASDDQFGPGQCPVQVDASDDQYGPGQCPVQVDASHDQYGPGECPVLVDAGEDAMGPGLCPYPTDAAEEDLPPGLC